MPLVTVIDTPGADLSPNAEEGALAGEIARCIADMTSLTVPSVSVLLGEGTGGGALALLPARRVIASSNAWLSPLPPEGRAPSSSRTPSTLPCSPPVSGWAPSGCSRTGWSTSSSRSPPPPTRTPRPSPPRSGRPSLPRSRACWPGGSHPVARSDCWSHRGISVTARAVAG
uniref:Uncharacterized protein n=1 Tax=Janibacter limosus TaxID=53458 RepID=A0AC61U8I0_9MICO|nr:carboxyl transferase domain-containing protein [Janibacter limosus]